MSSQQEPSQEPNPEANEKSLEELLARVNLISAAERECVAGLMRARGNVREIPCIPCQFGLGPWNSCVVVDHITGISHCANCHWEGNTKMCVFPDRVFALREPLPAAPAAHANYVEDGMSYHERLEKAGILDAPYDHEDEYIEALVTMTEHLIEHGRLNVY